MSKASTKLKKLFFKMSSCWLSGLDLFSQFCTIQFIQPTIFINLESPVSEWLSSPDPDNKQLVPNCCFMKLIGRQHKSIWGDLQLDGPSDADVLRLTVRQQVWGSASQKHTLWRFVTTPRSNSRQRITPPPPAHIVSVPLSTSISVL